MVRMRAKGVNTSGRVNRVRALRGARGA
jgi:hypothetical protein